MKATPEQRRKVAVAAQEAAVFLLPPHEHKPERIVALLTAAELVSQAVEFAVRGGNDELAHKLLALSQRIEAGARQ